MERNRDLRRASGSAVNGLPTRRQRVTTIRDSPEADSHSNGQVLETVRFRDRERLQLQKKDNDYNSSNNPVDREVSKRRRIGAASESSDEEYYEDEEVETRNHRRNQPSSSSSASRRGLRTLRSSPVLRAAIDEMIGVPVPRRARSSSAKKLHEYCNSGRIGENRRFSPLQTASYTDVSMKKKRKPVVEAIKEVPYGVVSDLRRCTETQHDIEIEVAEALFDLMKQSHSQSKTQDHAVDRDDDSNGKEESSGFSVQMQEVVKNGETVEEEIEEKLGGGGEEMAVSGGGEGDRDRGFVKVGSRKENESQSSVSVVVKVNNGVAVTAAACDIQDPTVTKPNYAEAVVESKKEAKFEIDLMAPPPLPSSPEKDAVLVCTSADPKVTTQDVQKKGETMSKDSSVAAAIRLQEGKIGALSSNQFPTIDMEKARHDLLSLSKSSTALQQRDWREQQNQAPLSFPIGTSGWPGLLPYPGYMPPMRAALPTDGRARSSKIMQLPQFKFSRPRPKRCATHQYIAQNIHQHQELIKKSLCSGTNDASNLHETNSSNLKSLSTTQKGIPGNLVPKDRRGQNLATVSGECGKDKNSDAATDFNATMSAKSLLQQVRHQGPANNFMHAPGFIFPLGQQQKTMMAPANDSRGPPQSSSAVGNTSLPGGGALVSFSHPIFASKESAPYMAVLQNNGCPVPISTNNPLGGPQSATMPFLNSSFYSSRMFNISLNQQDPSLPHAPNASSSQSKQPQAQQQQTSSKVGDDKYPPKGTFALSFGSNASTTPALNFSSMAAQNSAIFQMLPDLARNGYQMSQLKNFPKSGSSVTIPTFQQHQPQQQLVQLQKHHMQQQMQQGAGTSQSNASTSNGVPNSFLTNNFQMNNHPIFSQVPIQTDNRSFPQQKGSQGQTPHIKFGNSSVAAASPFQGQQMVINGQPPLISKNTGSKASSTNPTLQSQETEASSLNGKSSPTCRRNVSSILSASPAQLPELKY